MLPSAVMMHILPQRASYLPTSPGLTKPELALRHGTEAAVLIILGASMTITGDPIASFDLLISDSPDDSFDSHFICKFSFRASVFKLLNCKFEQAIEEVEERFSAMREERILC